MSAIHTTNTSIESQIVNQPTSSREAVGKKSFIGKFVHIGPKFQDGMAMLPEQIPSLMENGVLQNIHSIVHQTNEKFSFTRNGFEFQSHQGTEFGKAIEELAKDPLNDENPAWENRTFVKALEKQMSAWGKSQGIDFTDVVWIDTVYRDTKSGLFKAVHLAHVDFPDGNTADILKGHSSWRSRVAEKLGPLTPKEYEKLNVQKIVNLWIPLDKKLTAEPLAMMDCQSVDPKGSHIRVYEDRRTTANEIYKSAAIAAQEGQKWYVKENMTLGDGIAFDCCATPHSAVSLPNQGDNKRTSVECRVLFVKRQLTSKL